MIKLSIIIPIKTTFSNSFLVKRISNLIDFFSLYKDIELVIVDSSIDLYSKKIAKLDSISYYYLNIEGIYSSSKARNYGTQRAKGEYILFYDVDLVVKNNFIEEVLLDIDNLKAKAKQAFTIYPCLYLSESQTTEINKKGLDDELFEKNKICYLKGYDDEVLYLAVNTSTILVSKEHFLNVGSYNEVYKGHGYEDFELIHRLFKSYQIIGISDDYIEDYKTAFPYLYKGFRKYYAYYALENFFQGKFSMHLWHSRPLTKRYYKNRINNFKIFDNQIRYDFNMLYHTNNNTNKDYITFIDKLMNQYGYNNKNFIGLKRLHKDSNNKYKGGINRKFRKFFLHPFLFFKDIKVFKINKIKNFMLL